MPGAQKNVAVIGAGLGGMSAAIWLASAGVKVSVFEKNARAGGKLNVLTRDGFTFDMGPSILTLPQYFRRLWDRAGRKMEEDITFINVRPHWRNFFEDGTVLDLIPEVDALERELRKTGGERLIREVRNFLDYAGRQYDLTEKGYFEKGLDTKQDFIRFYTWRDLLAMDYWHTMHQGVVKRIGNRYWQDIFDYFIKYVGSSALAAPGFMNLMPTIQHRFDLWYVKGGMYELARALQRLAEGLGVTFHFNEEIVRVSTSGRLATGVETQAGRKIAADAVVSNMEVIPAYERLLPAHPQTLKKLEPFEPACSGLVLHLGTKRVYPQLAHHNFFYSQNQRAHFNRVFKKKLLPDDPTLYVVAPSRTDSAVCPPGTDNIKILPHIPHLTAQPPDMNEYLALKERVLIKLERMGLTDLRKNIIAEDMWTPLDIQKNYYSNRGAIYGVVADRAKNFALKIPKASPDYSNLFFVGGSVNPGSGMPMAVLSGQNTGKLVEAWFSKV
jgi:diapolycopene oxygenase